MKVQLVLAGPYDACNSTRRIWAQACQQYGLALDVTDLDKDEGQQLEQSLKIKSFPALIVDGQIKAVGHPDKDAAFELVAKLCEKSA